MTLDCDLVPVTTKPIVKNREGIVRSERQIDGGESAPTLGLVNNGALLSGAVVMTEDCQNTPVLISLSYSDV